MNPMFDGVVEAYSDDDYGRRGGPDLAFDVSGDHDRKAKKNKNKQPVEVKHEGYTLEKALPRPGEKPSWARIGRRQLSYEDKALVDMAKQHRKKKGTTVDQDFKVLTQNQQGVVNRLLEDRNFEERAKNAKWILYDVQRTGKYGWRSLEVKQIQVIIKRVDKNLPIKNGEYTKDAFKHQYHDHEIIDLAEPNDPPASIDTGKKKNNKKPKKAKSFDGIVYENSPHDPLSAGLGSLGIVAPQQHHNHGHGHHDNQMPRDNHQFNQIAPPLIHPPGGQMPGPFPLDGQFQPQQHHDNHNFQQPFPHNGRQSFSQPHPFQPDPNVASPLQFDLPTPPDQQWPHPHQHHQHRDHNLPRAGSQSNDRRLSARGPNISASETANMRRLESKIDDLTFKMATWQTHAPSDSSGNAYEEDSLFSYPPSSITPPSSPGVPFPKSRGSLDCRPSSPSRHHPRYRSHRYRDVDLEPAYTSRESRAYEPERRRRERRPSLHHAHTYDDYPVSRGAEQRYLPPAPAPPRLQRRLTEYGYEGREYEGGRRGDYRGDRRERFEGGRREGGRRDMGYEGRRRSYIGGGGEYYH